MARSSIFESLQPARMASKRRWRTSTTHRGRPHSRRHHRRTHSRSRSRD